MNPFADLLVRHINICRNNTRSTICNADEGPSFGNGQQIFSLRSDHSEAVWEISLATTRPATGARTPPEGQSHSNSGNHCHERPNGTLSIFFRIIREKSHRNRRQNFRSTEDNLRGSDGVFSLFTESASLWVGAPIESGRDFVTRKRLILSGEKDSSIQGIGTFTGRNTARYLRLQSGAEARLI